MQTIPLMDCADGYQRADSGAIKTPTAKTAAYTVTALESGKLFTNRGASGSVTFTLPTGKAGMFFHFFKAVTAQNIVVNGGTNQTFTNSTNEAGGLTVVHDGTAWLALHTKGTWAVS